MKRRVKYIGLQYGNRTTKWLFYTFSSKFLSNIYSIVFFYTSLKKIKRPIMALISPYKFHQPCTFLYSFFNTSFGSSAAKVTIMPFTRTWTILPGNKIYAIKVDPKTKLRTFPWASWVPKSKFEAIWVMIGQTNRHPKIDYNFIYRI